MRFKRHGNLQGFGDDPDAIKPSLKGLPPPGGPKGKKGDGREAWTGEVSAVVYDRFGDFEGFHLETESGEEVRFFATEHPTESVVRRAWLKRVLIRVVVRRHDPHRPVSIFLLRAPQPCC